MFRALRHGRRATAAFPTHNKRPSSLLHYPAPVHSQPQQTHIPTPAPLEPILLSDMSRHPTAKWAQTSDKVYLTIELPDAKDLKLRLEPEGKFVFSATKDGVPYGVDIDLVDKVNVEESKVSVGVRSIVYAIHKSEKKWWSRLLKQQGKPPAFLKVDWDKWVDEDEEEKKGFDSDDMDFSKLDLGGDDGDDGDLDMDDFKDGEEGAETKGVGEEVETEGKDTKDETEHAAEDTRA